MDLRVIWRVTNSRLQAGGLYHQIWRVLASHQISVFHQEQEVAGPCQSYYRLNQLSLQFWFVLEALPTS